MEIPRAIITAGGVDQRRLPMQSLVDSEGESKTAIRLIVEEALAAGVGEVGIVVAAGDEPLFAAALGDRAAQVEFIPQAEARGFGHAVWEGRHFAAGDPFLLLVSDHLYVSDAATPCARQLVAVAGAESCAVSAVQATHESKIPNYGVIGGLLEPRRSGLYAVDKVVEKPSPTEAEQSLIVPGLRSGHYLCFFGMHVLTPQVMSLLEAEIGEAGDRPVNLSAALAALGQRERYLACEVEGRRYDIGQKYGLLNAQLATAFSGQDRDEVLTGLVDLLATSGR